VKGIIESKIQNHTFVKDDITFTFSKIKKLEGEAEVNIRKGKQVLCYEYACEVDWMGETEADECTGGFKLSDINPFDFDFQVELID